MCVHNSAGELYQLSDVSGQKHRLKSELHRHIHRLPDKIAALDASVQIEPVSALHIFQTVISR